MDHPTPVAATASGDAMLRLEGLSKRYPNGVEAVRSISLEVLPGEVFGLVGPNGAGKSTLLKVIAGLLRPEAGRVTVAGCEVTGRPSDAARWIGLMPDPLGVYTDISCREYLRFFGMVYGLEGQAYEAALSRAVELLGLGPWLDEEVETLSAGWQRRLALGRMLLLDVPVLLLDEPAAGLDIRARAELLGIVRRLAAMGRTIVISSHILPELEDLADRFAIMDAGRWIAAVGDQMVFDREQLRHGIGGARWRLQCEDAAIATAALTAAGMSTTPVPGGVIVEAATGTDAADGLRCAVLAGAVVTDFRRVESGLADVVLRVLQGEEAA